MHTIGENFSHYKIISAIGKGGMGEVYLAEDTRLERKVALKFLSADHAQDAARLKRFTQEARAASALNHQNILTIYEIGQTDDIRYIAAEYVEGETLRELLQKRPLSIDETLDIAIQAMSAVSAAHTAGIVHRDIKPENIMVRNDGFVKVLDFGLVKLINGLVEKEIDSEGDTKELITTNPGVAMGTAQYMSPEQARGKNVDTRTDIWSLGVVLYEMITGSPPFEGETVSDMLAAILRTEPKPLSFYIPNIHPELEFIIKKALGKDREDRYQVVKDFLLDLRILKRELEAGKIDSLSDPAAGPALSPTRSSASDVIAHVPGRMPWRWLAALAAVVLVGAAAGYLLIRNRPAEVNVSSSPSSSQITSWKSELSDIDPSRARFSPDGRIIAYAATKNGKKSVWLKQIGGGEPFTRKQNDETEETSPLWSPDGEQIAFLSKSGRQRGLWATPALGGSPVLLAQIDDRSQGLVHWSKDGTTIFFEMNQNLYSLDLGTKLISKRTNFDETKAIERGFNFSPDESRIVYADRKDGQKDLWISGLNGESPARLTNDVAEDSQPIWHNDGERVVYNSYRNGLQQICLAFVDGRPPVQLTFNDSDSIVSDISTDGTKILYTATKDESDLWGVRLDSGKDFQLTSDIGLEFWQDVSPNGESIAFQATRQFGGGDKMFHCALVSQRMADSRQQRLADDGFDINWSPDGSRLAYMRAEAGNNSIWITSAAGGDSRVLTGGGVVFGGHTQLPYNRMQSPDYQWSPDSRSLIYCAKRDGVSNVWQMDINGPAEKQLTFNQDNSLLFFNPLISPDGTAIAWLTMSTAGKNKREWSIWRVTDGVDKEIYRSESVVSPIGWSQSGRELILKSVDGAVVAPPFPVEVRFFQIDVNTNASKEIARVKTIYFQNVMLSRDRRTLAFVTRSEGSDAIQILPLTGGSPQTLISNNDARVYFSSLAFAPDGKTLYYGKQANWQVISMINNFK